MSWKAAYFRRKIQLFWRPKSNFIRSNRLCGLISRFGRTGLTKNYCVNILKLPPYFFYFGREYASPLRQWVLLLFGNNLF